MAKDPRLRPIAAQSSPVEDITVPGPRERGAPAKAPGIAPLPLRERATYSPQANPFRRGSLGAFDPRTPPARPGSAAVGFARAYLQSWPERSSAWARPLSENTSVEWVPFADVPLITALSPPRMASIRCVSSAAFLIQAPSCWV